MSIFKIQQDYANIMSLLANNEGEVTSELNEMLQINNDQLQIKGGNYVELIKALHSQTEYLANEAERIMGYKKRIEKTIDKLKANMQFAMVERGINKAIFGTNTVSLRTAKSVEVENEDLLPKECIISHTRSMVSKTKIKELIEQGVPVFGAKIVEKQSLIIK